MPLRTFFVCLLAVLSFAVDWSIALEFQSTLTNHAVLQRDKAIPIKGWAEPNTNITVLFDTQSYETKSDKEGHWQIILPAYKAGGPFNLIATTVNASLTINDLYFGDVWLASGQSNMVWKLKWGVDDWQEEVRNSDLPLIRYFNVNEDYSATPQQKIKNSEWVIANPKVSGNFSAVAWFFAQYAHQEKNIPIGIIHSAWGGTPAQTWIPTEQLAALKSFKREAQKYRKNPEKWNRLFVIDRENERLKRALITSKYGFDVLNIASEGFNDKQWQTVSLPNKEAIEGITWFRKEIILTDDIKLEGSASISVGAYPHGYQLYINNHFVGERVPEEKPKRIEFNASVFKKGKNTIAIRALSAWSNQLTFGTDGLFHLSLNNDIYPLAGHWRYSNTIDQQFPTTFRYWQKPGTLYNAMIHPLADYPIKGVLWYQGESNTKQFEYYQKLFSTLIATWRTLWKDPELPFIFAQLANYRAPSVAPIESDWAELREAQTQTLTLPATGMAVLIDIGDADDIHPRNKRTAAERLWLSAKKVAYGDDVVYSGPKAEFIYSHDRDLIVHFTHTGSGLKSHGDLLGFEIAGDDKQYVNAQAKIDGDKVILSAPSIRKPKSVRYAWADNPRAALYNVEGLPAIPFRLGE